MNAFRRAFEIFDSDGSGKMNFTEMDKLIMELSSGQDPTDEEVVEVVECNQIVLIYRPI